MVGAHNRCEPWVMLAIDKKYHPAAPPSPDAYTGHKIIIPHNALVNVMRKQSRTYRKNIYESKPPVLRTADHDALTTPGIQPSGTCVLILTAGLAAEDDDDDDDEEDANSVEILAKEPLDDGGVNDDDDEEDDPTLFFPFPFTTAPSPFGEYTVGNHLRNNS